MDRLKASRGNFTMRMSRRDRAVERLKSHISRGSCSDRIKASELMSIIQTQDCSISVQECGHVIRKAFTGIHRKRVHSKWYYYGIYARATGDESSKEDLVNKNDKPTVNTKASQLQPNNNHCKQNNRIKCKNDTINQEKNGRPFQIACFNICAQDMTSLDNCTVIGEGTFGKCMSGKYKQLPVAIKVFKGVQSVTSVHQEAKIMLQIPSHSNIAMLVGVQSMNRPYLLLTKLYLSDGKPQTYSNFVKNCHSEKQGNINKCLLLLLGIADALNHIHTFGIIHNDLKGNNIVVEGVNVHQHPVLIDFGKACTTVMVHKLRRKQFTEKEQQEYRIQFPHVAPEITKGQCPSYKSDAFSFGYLYCNTLKYLKQELVYIKEEKLIRDLGKKLTLPYPDKRASPKCVLSILTKDKLQ